MSHPLQNPHSTVRRTDAGAAGCVGVLRSANARVLSQAVWPTKVVAVFRCASATFIDVSPFSLSPQ